MTLTLKLDKSQRKEFGKYLFDLSKLVLVSFVIKLFEPGSPITNIGSVLTIMLGLTISTMFAMLGLYFSKE